MNDHAFLRIFTFVWKFAHYYAFFHFNVNFYIYNANFYIYNTKFYIYNVNFYLFYVNFHIFNVNSFLYIFPGQHIFDRRSQTESYIMLHAIKTFKACYT
jgi:hypothetical protein